MEISDPWTRLRELQLDFNSLKTCNTPQEAIELLDKQGKSYYVGLIVKTQCSVCAKYKPRVIRFRGDSYEYKVCGQCLIKALQLFEDDT